MTGSSSWDLLVRRDDTDVREIRPAPSVPLRGGQVRLAVEKFGLTALNATYVRLGDSELPFWDAFPGPPGYGRVPAWGFARVEESRHPEVTVGERYFGYLPMATHVTLGVDPVVRGFVENTPEREFLHPWYRTYVRAGEPSDLDDRTAVLRPLFSASFHVADCLAQRTDRPRVTEYQVRRDGPVPRSVLITSASSKTAVGLAGRLAAHPGITTVGVTSARNAAFVGQLGVYDTVVTYDDLAAAPVVAPAVLVDLTGQEDRLTAVYEHFAYALDQTLLVGYTHPDARIEPPAGLVDPVPEIFFTPPEEQHVIDEEGEESYLARYEPVERRFIQDSESWLHVRQVKGSEGALAELDAVLSGARGPESGAIVHP